MFIFSPIALIALFKMSTSMVNHSISDQCFALLRTSPFGATAISAYFMAVLFIWGT
jgi:hypothetical protein